MKRQAKLLPNLLRVRPDAVLANPVSKLAAAHLLFKKGAATTLGFRPSYWSYYPDTDERSAQTIEVSLVHSALSSRFALKGAAAPWLPSAIRQ